MLRRIYEVGDHDQEYVACNARCVSWNESVPREGQSYQTHSGGRGIQWQKESQEERENGQGVKGDILGDVLPRKPLIPW